MIFKYQLYLFMHYRTLSDRIFYRAIELRFSVSWPVAHENGHVEEEDHYQRSDERYQDEDTTVGSAPEHDGYGSDKYDHSRRHITRSQRSDDNQGRAKED